MPRERVSAVAIGFVRSSLAEVTDAPLQGAEGAPDAWLDLDPRYQEGMDSVQPGAKLIVLTWLHRADRTVLRVHPRDDPAAPLTGVFATRSQDRPNPIGLHEVTVRERTSHGLLVGPLEAVDGTPVLDLKIALER